MGTLGPARWLTGDRDRRRARPMGSGAEVRSPRRGLAVAVLLVGVVGALDYLSGWEVSFAIFYLIPVSLATWRTGRGAGLVVAGLSTVAWWVADRTTSPMPLHPLVSTWNAVMRLGIFALVALTLDELRGALARNEALARTDHLTGLPNGRGFFERATEELDRARSRGLQLTVGFVDLDDFKRINHELGHHGADALLGEWGRRIASCLRTDDVVGRVGGDEFALVLPHADGEDALGILERFWRDVATHARDLDRPVDFTLGAVTFEGALPPSVDELLREADRVMYAAKAAGKNRWVHETVGGRSGDEGSGVRTADL